MKRALYRSSRPRSLGAVVGQEHITTTLAKAIKNGRVRHAYLFSGPKGVGKTSVARILAHEVNQIPYKDDSVHLDIIEIDAASNRRIDEVRDLRDKVNITPTSAKFKVYIIDEVHMLTREAFNALLKTLEEPPEHCIFILATTEAHKLPETITSRTQHFTFKPVGGDKAVKHLGAIAKHEKIDITPEALQLLSDYGQGSFRDSISLLDQLNADGSKIDGQKVRELIGLPQPELLNSLLKAVASSEPKLAMETLDELVSGGASPSVISRLLSESLRAEAVKSGVTELRLALLRQLLEVPASPDPRQSLELAILEATSTPAERPIIDFKPVDDPPAATSPAVKADKVRKPTNPMKNSSDVDLSRWAEVLAIVQKKSPSLYAALRLAEPKYENGELTLVFEFRLHQQKASDAASLQQIGQAVEEVTGAKLKVQTTVDKTIKTPTKNAVTDSRGIENISNIFGDAEVLES